MTQLFAKQGANHALPLGMMPIGKNILVMSGQNPDKASYVAVKKEPESVVPYRGKMIPEGIWGLPPLSEAELKLRGVEFEGVWCSLTWKDQFGLASIKPYVAAGMPIKFEFENGNKLLLTQNNLAAFEAVWLPARLAFFPVD